MERQKAFWDYEGKNNPFLPLKLPFCSGSNQRVLHQHALMKVQAGKQTYFYNKLALDSGTLIGSGMIWEGVWHHGSWQRRQVFHLKNK